MTPNIPRIVSSQELADVLKLHRNTVLRMVQRGEIQPLRMQPQTGYRFDLDGVLEALGVATRANPDSPLPRPVGRPRMRRRA